MGFGGCERSNGEGKLTRIAQKSEGVSSESWSIRSTPWIGCRKTLDRGESRTYPRSRMHERPLICATWTFALQPCERALVAVIGRGSALDAVCSVAREVERDPSVDSVGFGGLPDSAGRVSLDACVMLSPRRCGCVCAMTEHPDAIDAARLVMERSPHVMLAGAGADAFAEAHGLPRGPMLAESARESWERAKRGEKPMLHVDPGLDSRRAIARSVGERNVPHDTVGVLALDGNGVLAGACSTSGLAYKLPGRVGDSPIPGHGLYVDPDVGAAVATGTGELVMGVSATFLAVEAIRRGASPSKAVQEVLARLESAYDLAADHQVGIIVLRRDGARSSGAIRPGFALVVADRSGTRAEAPEHVLQSDDSKGQR